MNCVAFYGVYRTPAIAPRLNPVPKTDTPSAVSKFIRPLLSVAVFFPVLLGGCVANVHEIALDKALIQVVDGMNEMRKHQQELANSDPQYRYLGTYVKDVEVTFNVSVAGDVGTSTGVSGGDGPVKGELTVTTDYKSGRSNQIVIKLGSLLDNTAITDGKISIDKQGHVIYGKPGKGGTAGQGPIVTPIQLQAIRKALTKAGISPGKVDWNAPGVQNALKAIKPEVEKSALPSPTPQ